MAGQRVNVAFPGVTGRLARSLGGDALLPT